MQVRVDEAGDDQLAAVVDGFEAGRQRGRERGVVAGGLDAAILDDQQAVFMKQRGAVVERRIGAKVQQAGAIGLHIG